ncbi:MAG: elongation factor Ts [Clostridia bacterium]|nr:elongation factor Ts [Clostridia bacterium]MBQ3870891.1 elongation factor Ts [Clostridia bacterium]
MANFTAKDVAELRAKTNCGMMDCKKALVEADGDFDEAIKILREKGLAVAGKKAARIAAEGVVDILVSEDGKTAVMIEVNAETDFVAKNASFRDFVKQVEKTILEYKPANVEDLLKLPLSGSEFTVEASLKDKIFTIGENMSIRRFVIVEGDVVTYIHGGGVTGVIVKMECEEGADYAECGKNVALQIAAMNPTYLDKGDVPASVIESEKEILAAQIKNDPKLASKPAAVIEKMISGRIEKYYDTNCLLWQEYVKDSNFTVGKYVESAAKEQGKAMKVAAFVVYNKGEGLQKREDDFAAEIEKLVKKD